MFMWLEINDSTLTSEQLFQAVAELKVITVPGSEFMVSSLKNISPNANTELSDGECRCALRIAFAAVDEPKIRDGIERLSGRLNTLLLP
jgi:DNA-binding transcriptional MocR family regulator